jgi:hypothetical protein
LLHWFLEGQKKSEEMNSRGRGSFIPDKWFNPAGDKSFIPEIGLGLVWPFRVQEARHEVLCADIHLSGLASHAINAMHLTLRDHKVQIDILQNNKSNLRRGDGCSGSEVSKSGPMFCRWTKQTWEGGVGC